MFCISIIICSINTVLRHPTPALLPGKSHGWRSLVGCSPWGREELDTTEWLHCHFSLFMHWRRKWQPTPVFLPGESQGRGKESYDQPRYLDSIFKSRDITLPTKVCLVTAMVFPVVMYGCESWTVKKAKHARIDAFELWCWRRLLRVLWLQGDPTSPFSWAVSTKSLIVCNIPTGSVLISYSLLIFKF